MSLYYISQIQQFLQIEGIGTPSIIQVYWHHFSSIYSLHVSVPHFGNPHGTSNFCFFFIIITIAVVIYNQRSLMLLSITKVLRPAKMIVLTSK